MQGSLWALDDCVDNGEPKEKRENLCGIKRGEENNWKGGS